MDRKTSLARKLTVKHALEQGRDIGHYGRLVFILGARHFLDNEELVEELVDNQTRHLWLHQEAAFHLGMAVGLRLAQGRRH